jgi:hypothetical protein
MVRVWGPPWFSDLYLFFFFRVPSSRGIVHLKHFIFIRRLCVCVYRKRIFDFKNNINCVLPPADVLIGGSASRPFGFFPFIFSSRLVLLLLLPPLGFLIAPEEGRAVPKRRWTGYSCCLPWSCLPPQSIAPHRHSSDVSFLQLDYCSYFDVKHPDLIPAEIECIWLTVWRVFPIFKPEWAISRCQSSWFFSNRLQGPRLSAAVESGEGILFAREMIDSDAVWHAE